jgi:uncharacterized protein YnzC (UPF0291/DUF896 family)
METINQVLQQMELKLEQATPGLPAQKHGNGFTHALATESLKQASDEQIKQVLRLAMVLIGLRAQNWPNDEEKIILLGFIRANFYQHKIGELRLAFELAVSGKLDLGENGATCYENFSCEYVGRIMRAYRKWASQEHESLPVNPTAGLLEYRMPRIDWAEEWEYLKEKAKSVGVENIVIVTQIYDYLVENGILKLTKEEKKELFQSARVSLISELTERSQSQMLTYNEKIELENLRSDQWAFIEIIKAKLQNRAKVLAVRKLV